MLSANPPSNMPLLCCSKVKGQPSRKRSCLLLTRTSAPEPFLVVHCCGCSVTKSCLTMTPWTAAHQSSLSFTISLSLLKLMSTESVMPSNHLILCHPLLLLPSIWLSIQSLKNPFCSFNLRTIQEFRQQLLLGLLPWWYSNLRPLDLIISTAGRILPSPNPRERALLPKAQSWSPKQHVSFSFHDPVCASRKGKSKGNLSTGGRLRLVLQPQPWVGYPPLANRTLPDPSLPFCQEVDTKANVPRALPLSFQLSFLSGRKWQKTQGERQERRYFFSASSSSQHLSSGSVCIPLGYGSFQVILLSELA